ncbi:hypothetical protein PE066_18990 [Ramlibacter tataouinensis]|uniref:hypothetical protein n=1 Tax=Ramlibacter tataouinensis TaxID=94132 RepID=UPI0022F3D4F9|nr:hypothetical protein [Ramlibacter tataouinensis]WBY01526.1 hypothetical protein PE066_18990 [Ramlibacter tataouinensis]
MYAAVHVVEEDGHILVLGSTCFRKRYGSAKSLGKAQFGVGSSRLLTEEERQIMPDNTAVLIARFEDEDRVRAAALASAAKERRVLQAREEQFRQVRGQASSVATTQTRPNAGRGLAALIAGTPWPWQSEHHTSVAVLLAPNGHPWVRVQHRDGLHRLVPWPVFPGWEMALPPEVGRPDPGVQGYAVADIATALQLLQERGFSRPNVGRWRDVRPRN